MNKREHSKEAKYGLWLKLGMIIVLVLAVGAFIFLNNQEKPSTNTGSSHEQTTEKEEIEITLFFPNKTYIELADDSLGRMITEVRVLAVDESELADEVVKALINGPRVEDAEKVLDGAIINDVNMEDSIAIVDFVKDSIHKEGTLTESMTVESIVRTLDNIEGVDGVRILLDGEDSETFSGHVDISGTLTSADYDF